MIHNTCNMDTRDLPDMYALGLQAYISGKSLVPMLQLLHVACRFWIKMSTCFILVYFMTHSYIQLYTWFVIQYS